MNSLQAELQVAYIEGAEENDDDVIYALVIGNRYLDGLPKAPYHFSDKTCNVAFIYKRAVTNSNRAKIKKLSLEILEINMIIEKIEIALTALNKYQQQLIKQIYFKEIPSECNLAEERRIKKEKRKALEIMSKIMRITEETFYNIISKVK